MIYLFYNKHYLVKDMEDLILLEEQIANELEAVEEKDDDEGEESTEK